MPDGRPSEQLVRTLSHPWDTNPEFAGKTGNGDWADCLAEMDYGTGQIIDALNDAGVEQSTLVIFASDNGPEAIDPWEGDSGPWRGTYFTAMEASLRAPFIIRWPRKVPAGRVSNEIVHIVDMYPTLARVGGAEAPKDRPIDGVDQLDLFLGKQENSNREGFPAYVAPRISGFSSSTIRVNAEAFRKAAIVAISQQLKTGDSAYRGFGA